jgi:hypothetical protein
MINPSSQRLSPFPPNINVPAVGGYTPPTAPAPLAPKTPVGAATLNANTAADLKSLGVIGVSAGAAGTLVLDIGSSDGQLALTRALRSPHPETGQKLNFTVNGRPGFEVLGAVPLEDIVSYLDAHRPAGIAAIMTTQDAAGRSKVVVRGTDSSRLAGLFKDAINGSPVVYE